MTSDQLPSLDYSMVMLPDRELDSSWAVKHRKDTRGKLMQLANMVIWEAAATSGTRLQDRIARLSIVVVTRHVVA
jgi:hypothetical protein